MAEAWVWRKSRQRKGEDFEKLITKRPREVFVLFCFAFCFVFQGKRKETKPDKEKEGRMNVRPEFGAL